MSSSRRTSRRRRIKITKHQGVAIVAGLVVVGSVARAVAGMAASWWDVLAVGVAAAVLVLLLTLPTPRRRPRNTSIYRRPASSNQRVANEVLAGGHPAWAAPAQARAKAEPKPKAVPHQELRMRLAVAEELLTAGGLAADYRDVVSALEQPTRDLPAPL